jgi:hypothetical protein
MPAPGVLMDLALTLDAEQPEARQRQAAVLASRLGYVEVWLPTGGAPAPDTSRLAALAAAAAPARLGAILTDAGAGAEADADAAVAWLLRLPPGVADGMLLDLPRSTPELIRAVGGADAWRARVRLPAFEPAAAGTVIATPYRDQTMAEVAAAASARARSGLTGPQHPITASLPVSIGRTVNEAEARASRDPRFAGAGHPRGSGLFGTHEQAQSHVLDLAAAGADALRVTVPDEVDVADLLAQVRSLVVGATPVLHARRGS